MVEKRKVTIYDLLPFIFKQKTEDPDAILEKFFSMQQDLHEVMRAEIAAVPYMLSPFDLNKRSLVSGPPNFSSNPQSMFAEVKASPGINYTVLGTGLFPASDMLNGFGLYFQTGPNAGVWNKVLDYDGTTGYAKMVNDWVGLTSQPEQLFICYADRVWLPEEASDKDEYYTDLYVRVDGGSQSIEPQLRRITKYIGSSRLAYVEPTFEFPPAPDSKVSVVTTNISLAFLARYVGMRLPQGLSEGLKRQLIGSAIDIYKLKGTKAGFEILLRMLGWGVELFELGSNYSSPDPRVTTGDLDKPYNGAYGPVNLVIGYDGYTISHPVAPHPSLVPISTTTILIEFMYESSPGGPGVSGRLKEDPANLGTFKVDFGIISIVEQSFDKDTGEFRVVLSKVVLSGTVEWTVAGQSSGLNVQIPLPRSDAHILPPRGEPWGFLTNYHPWTFPEHKQYLNVSTFYEGAYTPAYNLPIGPTDGTFGTRTIVRTAAFDLVGATNSGKHIPDSDLRIFVEPLKPLSEPPSETAFTDILFALEDVRPVHVEIDGIGWMHRTREESGVEEDFSVKLFLAIEDAVTVTDGIISFTADQEPFVEPPVVTATVKVRRILRWDTTQDRWDGGDTPESNTNSWDEHLIGMGS